MSINKNIIKIDSKIYDIAKIWFSTLRKDEERYLPATSSKAQQESAARALEGEARFYGFKCKVSVKDHLSANAAAGESSELRHYFQRFIISGIFDFL